MQKRLPRLEVVLLGVGHTNAHVLRMWKMRPLPGARLTCISNFPVVTYSGMLPGVLSGQYARERMEIDLVRLCAAAGARLILEEVTGLDRVRQRLLFADRPPLAFDLLSVGIGSVPAVEPVALDDALALPVKPMQTFLPRLEDRLRRLQRERPAGSPWRIATVGGGVGGVEITLCLPARIRQEFGQVPLQQSLVTGSGVVGAGLRPGTSRRLLAEFQRRGVQVITDRRVVRVAGGQLHLDDGGALDVDLVLWTTGAVAPPLLNQLGLPQDGRGFLWTLPTLQCLGEEGVFAVGDSGTIQATPTPKSGVYAVRQGPILWENLQRSVRGEPLREYVPQAGFMKLLNLGNGESLGDYKGCTFRGRWVWRLKDRIDSRFMDMYQDYTPAGMPAPVEGSPPAMRCAGCGSKVGGTVLSRALRRLEIAPDPRILLGLDRPDDVAVFRPDPQQLLSVTTDFFTAPLADEYLSGRVAALNAASDLFASGAAPLAALALTAIPPGDSGPQEECLFQLLRGMRDELEQMGAVLIGGHTIEADALLVGLTMFGQQSDAQLRLKGGLRPGDCLILTKPLGSGLLLAAHQLARCRAEWLGPLRECLLSSNQTAFAAVRETEVSAVTDVTGFGLAGHLLEMLKPSGLSAVLHLQQLPLLPGARELALGGLESTLAPANRAAEADIEVSEHCRALPEYALLFDPQTSGGLLIGVNPDRAGDLLAALSQGMRNPPAVLGNVLAAGHGGRSRIVIESGLVEAGLSGPNGQ